MRKSGQFVYVTKKEVAKRIFKDIMDEEEIGVVLDIAKYLISRRAEVKGYWIKLPKGAWD